MNPVERVAKAAAEGLWTVAERMRAAAAAVALFAASLAGLEHYDEEYDTLDGDPLDW